MESNVINFYSIHDEDTGYFSNFYSCDILLDDKIWPTSEHYFQAAKFFTTDLEYSEKIRKVDGPGKAAKLGRDRKKPFRSD